MEGRNLYNLNICLVNQDTSEEHWRGGCKMVTGEPLGCTQHEFVQKGHNVTSNNCICRDSECNGNKSYGK